MVIRMKDPIEISPDALWNSIDMIAVKQKVSLPKLALQAGLDQSTFGHARRRRNWMSLQTLVKVLNHYQISLVDWAKMVEVKR